MIDIEKLRGMSQEDALNEAAKYAGVSPSTIDSIWRVESNRGQHRTMVGPDTSVGNAKGHFQIIDANVNALSGRYGRKLDPFDFYDSLGMASELLKDGMQRWGNEADAVSEYHGSPDKRQWGPKTQAYLAAVLGDRSTSMVVTRNDDQPTRSNFMHSADELWVGQQRSNTLPADILWNAHLQPIRASSTGSGTGLESVMTALGSPPDNNDSITQTGTTKFEDHLAGIQNKKDNQEFVNWHMTRDSTVGAAYQYTMNPYFRFIQNTFMQDGEAYRHVDPEFRKDFQDNWGKYLSGYSYQDQDFLLDSKNELDYRSRVRFLEEQNANLQTVANGGGTATQMTAMILAGVLDPTTYAAGYGAVKSVAATGRGSYALAQAGRTKAALASLYAENALGNVMYDAVRNHLGEYKTTNDYIVSAATGIFPAALGARGTVVRSLHAQKLHIAQSALDAQKQMYAQALENAGPTATAQEVADEFMRLNEKKSADIMESVTGTPNREIIIPDIDNPEVLRELLGGHADDTPHIKQSEPVVDTSYEHSPTVERWDTAWRAGEYDNTPDVQAISRAMGKTPEQLRSLDAGVHISDALKAASHLADTVTMLSTLGRKFLGEDSKLFVGLDNMVVKSSVGESVALGRSNFTMLLKSDMSPAEVMTTAVHELGHLIYNRHAAGLTPEMRTAIHSEWRSFVKEFPSSSNEVNIQKRYAPQHRQEMLKGGIHSTDYTLNSSEYLAESFVKYINDKFSSGNNLGVAPGVVKQWTDSLSKVLDFLKEVFSAGYLKTSDDITKFFDDVFSRDGAFINHNNMESSSAAAQPVRSQQARPMSTSEGTEIMRMHSDELSKKYGLDTLPIGDAQQRMEFRFIHGLYEMAEEWIKNNPIDWMKTKTINDNRVLNVATPGTLLVNTDNALAQWIVGELMEHTMGATGRRPSASIASVIKAQAYIGNTINEFNVSYTAWRDAQVGKLRGVYSDVVDTKLLQQFNKEVMLFKELELQGKAPANPDPMILRAAKALEETYTKALQDQKAARTTGFAALPDNSVGYVPHKLNAAKILDMPKEDIRVYQDMLRKQFIAIEGMDGTFADKMSRVYIDHAIVNASAGHEIPGNIHNPNTVVYLEEAMRAAKMPEAEIKAFVNKMAAGGLSHTKQRFHLDLSETVTGPSGKQYQLVDLFQTDHISLMRDYSRRVAGEVALTQWGIQGRGGARLLDRALQLGDTANNTKVSPKQLAAYRQFMAEMTGMPHGDHVPQYVDNIIGITSMSNLGAMMFPQLAETMNMAVGIGIINTLKMIPEFPALLKEARMLADGKKLPSTSPLHSIELMTGYEFGMQPYKMRSPFDGVTNVYESVGKTAIGPFTRMLRRASYYFPIINMHRAVQAVQQRHAGNQIIIKALRYINEGKNSTALADMGFTPELSAAVKADMHKVAVWRNGRLDSFDPRKFSNPETAQAFSHAVIRGVNQLIQGAFPGEIGHWQHSTLGRFFSQFRTFGILAQEKQWGRHKHNYGVFAASAILLGTAAFALPIHLLRLAINARGMSESDKDKYFERMMAPAALARSVLNYTSSAGVLPDIVDIMGGIASPFAQDSGLINSAVGRTGNAGSPLTAAIPGLSWADSVMKLPQNYKRPRQAVRVLPYSNVPTLVPILNALTSNE